MEGRFQRTWAVPLGYLFLANHLPASGKHLVKTTHHLDRLICQVPSDTRICARNDPRTCTATPTTNGT
jgi:hypothetical protein